jgi:hypothetical protein
MVGIGDDVMIGGFIIPDGGTKTVIARAIGPSLGALGVSDPLQNPILQLYDSAGALIGTNDDWRSAQEQEILATHLAPGNNLESAIVTDLEPGAYTAIVSGANGSTGVALVEIYDLAPETGKLGNISTRGYVGLDDDVLIGGFTVVGPQSEQLLVRGIGPSLANSGVLDPLAKPFLAIYNSNGDVFRSSDDSTAIEPSITFESAPGSFTAILSSINYLPGVGLIAIYAEN